MHLFAVPFPVFDESALSENRPEGNSQHLLVFDHEDSPSFGEIEFLKLYRHVIRCALYVRFYHLVHRNPNMRSNI
jgi:hypothetical protein